MSEFALPVPPAEDRPYVHLAEALRTLISLTVQTAMTPEAAASAAVVIEELTATAAAQGSTGSALPALYNFFVRSPVSGIFNPIASPVELSIVAGSDGGYREIRGAVTFGAAYEGPPGCVHGGVIAGALDDAVGQANAAAGLGGVTGSLSVHYRKPTPLGVPLRIEARCTETDGRKVRSWAGIYHDQILTAEAEAVCFIVHRTKSAEGVDQQAVAGRQTERADPLTSG